MGKVHPFTNPQMHNLLTEELHGFPSSSSGTRLTAARAQLFPESPALYDVSLLISRGTDCDVVPGVPGTAAD